MDDNFDIGAVTEYAWDTARQMIQSYMDDDGDRCNRVLNELGAEYGESGVYVVAASLFFIATCGGRVASVFAARVDEDGDPVEELPVEQLPPQARLLYWMLRGLADGDHSNSLAAWRSMDRDDQVNTLEYLTIVAADHERRHPKHNVMAPGVN